MPFFINMCIYGTCGVCKNGSRAWGPSLSPYKVPAKMAGLSLSPYKVRVLTGVRV